MTIHTDKTHASSAYLRRYVPVLLCYMAALYSCAINAAPFTTYDGRSAALAGVGVAANARNAAYYNPALLGTDIEEYDAILLAPVYSQATVDPDDLEQGIDDMRKVVLNPADTAAIQAQLDKLQDTTYEQNTIRSLVFIIPSTTLGASAFVNSYDYNTVSANIGGDNLGASPPTYASTLDHRAVKITEIGAGVGKLFGLSNFFLGDMQIGVAVKLLLLQNYGYSESIDVASLGLDDNQLRRDSMINFDLGLVKEVGVWKMGLVVKNILSENFTYGTLSDTFAIEPQARLGFAYQSRRTLLEFDADLTQNKGIGFAQDSSYASMGWEYKLYDKVFVRAGARQNLIGDKSTTGTFGLGFGFWDLELDIAAMSSDREKGLYASFAYKI